MTLQDSLFTIASCQKDEATAVYRVTVHPEWPIYKAHFPGHPVTPGVCIVQMVQELLQDLLGSDLCLRQAKNVKYVAIISPDEVSTLTVTFSKVEEQPDGSVKVQAQVTNGETVYTKLSATFGRL